jgi:hypothetical protein
MAKEDTNETTTTTTTETAEQVAEREAANRAAENEAAKAEAVQGRDESEPANDPPLGDDTPTDALEARETAISAAKAEALANHAAQN